MKFWDLEFVLLWVLLLSKQDVYTTSWYIAIVGLIFSIGRIMSIKSEVKNVASNTDQIETLVAGMKKDGYDFEENPAIFKWDYSAHPELELTLVIKNKSLAEIGGSLGRASVH